MITTDLSKKPLIENSTRISVGSCVRNYLLDQSKINNKSDELLNLNNEDVVKKLVNDIGSGTTINLRKDFNGKIEFTESNHIKITYTKSNLGKGFIFWFLCNLCASRTRYLYIPPNSHILACRKCHRLAYDRQNDSRNLRELSRLFGY